MSLEVFSLIMNRLVSILDLNCSIGMGLFSDTHVKKYPKDFFNELLLSSSKLN